MTTPRSRADADLRFKADARLQGLTAAASEVFSAAKAQRLLHELQVHQVELAMQNEELQASRDEAAAAATRYTELYDHAPVGYLTLDRSGRIVQINLAGASLLGSERAGLTGKRLNDFVAEPDLQLLNALLLRAFAGEAAQACEARLRASDMQRTVQIEASRSEDGSECRMVLHDITARKQATDKLAQHLADLEHIVSERTKEILVAKEAAEAANRAKSSFLAAASHDLRQPLQAISLFSYALAKTELNPKQKRLSDHLSLSAQSLDDLLNALLDISKFDAGHVSACPKPMHAGDLLDRICAQYAPLAAAKALKFKLHVPAAAPLIFSDEQLLQSLLGNLVGNAIKCTERGGILVCLRLRGDRVLVQVWDTGVGIAAEHMNRIFDEYFQVRNTERNRVNGLGLGLSIARRVARLLDTEIVCHSKLGRGTVFEFLLPIENLPPTSASSRSEAKVAKALAFPDAVCRRIVVIEDDAMVAEALKLSLEACGARVTCYSSAEAALDSPDITDADFYFSDSRLPGLGGAQLLDAIQQRTTSPIKASLLSGEVAARHPDASSQPRWSVLYKPVGLATLLSAMESQGLNLSDPPAQVD